MSKSGQLNEHGVHRSHYVQFKHWYQTCFECQQIFTLKEKPHVLLKCGHVVCSKCLDNTPYCQLCKAKGSDIQKIVAEKVFLKLLKKEEGERFYRFTIFMEGILRPIKHKVSENTTFSEILLQFPGFEQYATALKDNAVIAIGTKTLNFNMVQNQPVKKYQANLKVKNNNLINILPMFKGGNINPIC